MNDKVLKFAIEFSQDENSSQYITGCGFCYEI